LLSTPHPMRSPPLSNWSLDRHIFCTFFIPCLKSVCSLISRPSSFDARLVEWAVKGFPPHHPHTYAHKCLSSAPLARWRLPTCIRPPPPPPPPSQHHNAADNKPMPPPPLPLLLLLPLSALVVITTSLTSLHYTPQLTSPRHATPRYTASPPSHHASRFTSSPIDLVL